MFEREREGLEALAGAGAGSGLKIPEVVALSPPGPSAQSARPAPPILVLEYLAPAPAGSSERAWEELGRGLAALHRKSAEGFGFYSDNYCGLTPQENAWSKDWAGFYGDRRIGVLVKRLEKEGKLEVRETAVFRKLRDRLPALLDQGPAPSLLHGDLWSGNFLSSDQGPALIDPAAYYGDREAEWGMMLLFGGFPGRVLDAYQEAWPLPQGWRERLPLYQLYHLLNHFLLFGGGYGGQALQVAARYL
jgi:fructosamine-3-kinase